MVDFDESQRRVLDAPPQARRIVVAGPGAGKTALSVALIGEIDATAGAAEDRQILFLSFSRAAVKAAFNAFGSIDGDYRATISAMTLDSLAWQLTETDPCTDAVVPVDFDRVVREATSQLERRYEGEFDGVIHVIVDEAQDLALARRALLCAVIDRLPEDAGVTIFGDPLQSIYEFLDGIANHTRKSAWDNLLDDLRARSITTILTLDGGYRARRRGPRKVAAVGSRLRRATADDQVDLLDDLVSDLTHFHLTEFAGKVQDWAGSTAVLVRTNAEVALVFDYLSRSGVRCRWRESGRNRPFVAPWVAQLWSALGGAPVSQENFRDFAESVDGVDRGWFRFLHHSAGSGKTIDWRAIARTCARAEDTSDPWFEDFGNAIQVLTIHQAKGLEFDNVAVVGARSILRPPADREPEAELLFVALSRARDKVVVINWEPPYTKHAAGSGRLYVPHPAHDIPAKIFVTPDDLRLDVQIGTAAGQAALAEHAHCTDLEFELLSSGGAEWPSYRCRVDEEVAGATTPQFGMLVARALRMQGQSGRWPSLGSVPLDGVESTWSQGVDVRFWLRPRPFGFSDVCRER
ncbi:hypothetical protein CBI38_09740 [Rhodococcus oxybenzonivorans]|uniref:UvrD-like helicase C-terminal domain-containing protein n=1 Tax=Rhodococcus oxybenzonivorans TaxID=1990687 RepID=A0A2S2BTB5_9NOCA|nr:ATP-binding domain-containing protein [Rhodococcus oxybenzonivorans]AWK71829.1 hypothetical protein CBI38_09740 [Rhodococcus oxybenzonivorans]